jgi:hypothetical protein
MHIQNTTPPPQDRTLVTKNESVTRNCLTSLQIAPPPPAYCRVVQACFVARNTISPQDRHSSWFYQYVTAQPAAQMRFSLLFRSAAISWTYIAK